MSLVSSYKCHVMRQRGGRKNSIEHIIIAIFGQNYSPMIGDFPVYL